MADSLRPVVGGLVEDVAFQRGARGSDRAVLLAHGAGSDLAGAPLRAVADALSAAGIASLRFNFPYRTAGRRAPDRPPKLAAAVREAGALLAQRAGLPRERLVLGGRSMGGRICSLVVADPEDPLPALGLLLLGYPLHAAGKPQQVRDDHFARVRVPALFVSGTRDALAAKPDLVRSTRKIAGPVALHWLESADHGFKPLRASGLTTEGVLTDVADVAVAWVRSLPS